LGNRLRNDFVKVTMMDGTAWSSGGQHPTFGIRVGFKNRDQYFQENWESIDVEMDGQVHEFRITAGFWNKCPEFRDSGGLIRKWLTRHKTIRWPKGNPPSVTLLPIGSRRFRLIP